MRSFGVAPVVLVLLPMLSAQGSQHHGNVVPAGPAVLDAFGLRAATVQDIALPPDRRLPFSVSVVLDGRRRVIDLRPFSIRAPGFQLLVDDGVAMRPVPAPAEDTWRGEVAGEPESDVAASLRNGALRAYVTAGTRCWAIQPLSEAKALVRRRGHVVYAASDVLPSATACGVSEAAPPAVPVVGAPVAGGGGASAGSAIALQNCQMALDCDLEYFQQNGSNVAATQSAATLLMAAMNVIYRRDVQICYTVTTIIVRTARTYVTGPETGCNASGLLQEMTTRWQQNHIGVVRDTAHLLSGQGVFNGTIGCANVGVICDGPIAGAGYGVSRVVGSNMVDNVGLLAHEVGHNWSASHCDATPPCNIMCASQCASPTSFGPAAVAEILAHKSTRACLSTCSGCRNEAVFGFAGTGCAGTGAGSGPGCLAQNFNGTTANTFFAQAFEIALSANSGSIGREIVGVDFFCRALSTSIVVPVRIRADAGGEPGGVLATGTMNVGTTNGNYGATFATPATLPANTDFFVTFDNPAGGLIAPIAGSGTSVAWSVFFGSNWSPQPTPQPWNFRVNCVGAGAVPWLDADGLPTRGARYDVTLERALPNTIAVLLWGAGAVALDLTVVRAPGCFLYVNPIVATQPTVTTPMGTASWPQSIPNRRSFCGGAFYQQVAVVDAGANPFQIVTTRRGEPLVGN